MTIFEPLFILLFLATVVTLVTATVAALRGQRPRAGRILPAHHVGETICFDDWCFAVADAKQSPAGAGKSWNVTDSRNRRFDPDPASSTVPLDSKVAPGQSLDITRTFDLPADATDVSLVFTHEGGFPIESLIIGENQLFHHAR